MTQFHCQLGGGHHTFSTLDIELDQLNETIRKSHYHSQQIENKENSILCKLTIFLNLNVKWCVESSQAAIFVPHRKLVSNHETMPASFSVLTVSLQQYDTNKFIFELIGDDVVAATGATPASPSTPPNYPF